MNQILIILYDLECTLTFDIAGEKVKILWIKVIFLFRLKVIFGPAKSNCTQLIHPQLFIFK